MADVTFVTNVDLANNELRNAKAQVLSTDPTGVEGKFVYNSTDKQLKFYNGTAWVSGGASVANLSGQASAFGQSASNGSAATAARSDHYHALPAHDASAHSAIKLSDLAAPSANLAMGGYKLTGLGAGSANGDSVRYEQVVGVYLPLAGGTLSGVLTVDPTANATDYPVIVKNNITKDSRLFVQRPVGAATAGITLGDSAGKSEAMMHVNNNGLGIALRMNGSTDTSQISFYSGDTLGATVGTTDIGIRAKLVEFQATSVRLPADTTIGANISAAELGYLDGVTSAIQTQLNAKAPSASPTFTGTPAAPTAAVDTNTTQVATTAFVIGQGYLKSSGYTAADVLTKIKTVDGSGSGLDADLLDGQNSSAFAAASHTHAQSDVTNLVSDLAAKAPLASPAFTGTPTAPTPTAGDNSTKIATTAYVDAATSAAASGLDVKNSVRAATSVAGTSPPSGAGADYSTGVTLANGDRVLVKSQANATRNGIYIVNTGGAWTRATDFDSNADVTPGAFCFVEAGTWAGTGWVLTPPTATVTLGTTDLNFTQFSGAGTYGWGNGLSSSGTTVNVGAGTGITVAADTVAIDTAVVARKYSATLSGTAASQTVTHNLGTQDVQVTVRRLSDNVVVYTGVTAATTNTVTIDFATTVTANAYRVTVVG